MNGTLFVNTSKNVENNDFKKFMYISDFGEVAKIEKLVCTK
jgi:hypothetical protein